jgi:hypothetical protein
MAVLTLTDLEMSHYVSSGAGYLPLFVIYWLLNIKDKGNFSKEIYSHFDGGMKMSFALSVY